jgi:hypothetical protein
MWAKMPALMIRKVALVSAMREAFSENVGGLYTTDEMNQAEPIDVTPQPSREEVIAEKQAQIEACKQQQAEQEQETKHSGQGYPADEIPDFGEEPVQSELLEY